MNFFQPNAEKGVVAILITVLIVGVVLVITFGLATIFATEIKISGLIGQSAPAYYAAETGAEYALYQSRRLSVPASISPVSDTLLSNGATFEVSWDTSGTNSLGEYRNVRRKIQVNW